MDCCQLIRCSPHRIKPRRVSVEGHITSSDNGPGTAGTHLVGVQSAQRYGRVCLLSGDVQTAILRTRTVEGGIRTRKAIVIVVVEVGYNRKRA